MISDFTIEKSTYYSCNCIPTRYSALLVHTHSILLSINHTHHIIPRTIKVATVFLPVISLVLLLAILVQVEYQLLP